MSLAYRLYFLRGISQFGSWLTFLAIALLMQERYGNQHVAFAFLIQSVPPLLFSRYLVKLVPSGRQYKAFIICQILLAVNVAALTLDLGIWQVYFYLITASFIGALATPIFQSLIGEWIEKDRQAEVNTRLGAIVASLLMITPPLGGIISTRYGFNTLFILDALSFLIGVLFLLPQPPALSAGHQSKQEDKAAGGELTSSHRANLSRALLTFYLFLCVGALLNSIEFAVFKGHGFDQEQVGIVLGAWGAGNLVAFSLAASKHFQTLSVVSTATAFSVSIFGFVLFPSYIASIITFLIAGFSYANISGHTRAYIQAAIPPEIKSITVWALVNQRTSLINIAFYGTAGWLLPHLDLSWFGWALLLLCLVFSARLFFVANKDGREQS